MALLSKNYHSNGAVEKLTPYAVLGGDEKKIKGIRRAIIISAYYSDKFIINLFSKIPESDRPGCEVFLIFNGFSGLRLKRQIEELKEIKNKLEKKGFNREKMQIFLNKKFDIFHPKLYYFIGDDFAILSIGSANASNQAFQKNGNEEVIYQQISSGKRRTQEMRALIEYTNQIIDNSDDADECFEIDNFSDNYLEKNIISFFRSGLIYFKPVQQLQFTYNEVKFSEDIENQLSKLSVRPHNTDKGKIWGPLNVLSILGIGDMNEILEIDKSRLSIKPWSIETCYGFWVPSAYCDNVDEKIDRAELERMDKFSLIKKTFNKAYNDNSLNSAFNNYINQINEIFENNEIDFCINDKSREGYAKKFNYFIDNFKKRINDDKFMQRYTLPLMASEMPEIWQDEVAYSEFKTSYFEYLSFAASGRQPLIVNKILTAIKADASMLYDPDILEDALEKYIRKIGWSDKKWDK
jgi:hypothetical protein